MEHFTCDALSFQNPVLSGTNIYGILRAGRALGTESIILSAPHLSHGSDNSYGIATMMALANYFKSKTKFGGCYSCWAKSKTFYYLHSAKNYWAKDIIFLVTSHDEVGMQAWIDSYMGLHSPSKREICFPPSLPSSPCA